MTDVFDLRTNVFPDQEDIFAVIYISRQTLLQ